jgi:ferritin-like metal-binding protein YciE
MKNRNNTTKNSNKTPRNGSEPAEETSMENNPLHELLIDEIGDIYNAEQQLVKALPKMVKAAQSEELREAFESHLEETQNQVKRLEDAVENLGAKMPRKKCPAMEGLIEEAAEMMQEYKDEPTIDAVLIAAAQKVEHYEIATYGTLAAWSRQMGHDDATDLFEESLEEEKAADEKLTEIAESLANAQAESQD